MNLLKLACNKILSDIKTRELKVLVWVILISVITVYTISTLTESVKDALETKSGEVLGGNKVVSSAYKIPNEIKSIARENNLQTSEVISFSSVIINSASDKFALGSIKAVTSSYPLLGTLRVADNLSDQEYDTNSTPNPGEVWLEPRLLLELGLNVNQKVKIGETELSITKLITYEPDRIGIYAFTPRALVNSKDLPKINVLKDGSRARFSLQLTGSKLSLENFERNIPKKYAGTFEVDTPSSARPTIKVALDKGESFLGLCAIVNVLIAGIAIAVCSRRYSLANMKYVAILKTVGVGKNKIFALYFLSLIVIAFITSILGIVLGIILQGIYRIYLEKHLPGLELIVNLNTVLLSIVTALVLVLGFALPRIIQLSNVSPVSILKRNLILPNIQTLSIYLISILSLIFYSIILVKDIILLKVFFISLIGIGGSLLLIFANVVTILKKPIKNLGFYFRLGLNNLIHNSYNTAIQISSISIIITIAFVLFYIRSDLLDTWQSKIDDSTPNYFAVNISQEEINDISKIFSSNNVKSSKFYPIVRGRLLKINNEIVGDVENSSGKRGLNRPLNLTWSKNVPEDNFITSGKWYDETSKGEISVEKTLQQRLNLALNYTLTFKVGTKEITAKITSFREVDWDNFKPNFYVIYPVGVLNDFPHTYINSFFLPKEDLSLVNKIIELFPSINIIDITAILSQVKSIINIITNIVAFLWLQTFLIGLTLFYAMILSNIEERKRDNLIMQRLGASLKQISSLFFVEYISLGVACALLSLLVGNAITYFLTSSIFNLQYTFNIKLNCMSFLVIVCIVTLFGYFSIRNFKAEKI